MIPNPVDLQARDLTCRASHPGGKLRGEQKEPGLQGEVDRLPPKHTANVRYVPNDPVEVTEPPNQELVARGRVEVDNRELACTIDRKEVDLATGRTGNLGVDSPQPFLERPFEFFQDRRDLLARDVSRRPKQEGARCRLFARERSPRRPATAGVGTSFVSLLRQKHVRDIFESPAKWPVGSADIRRARTARLMRIHR